jgi:hypothetical protein
VDAALGRLGSDSRRGLEGLRDLVESVRRLEAKLDRMAAAVKAPVDERSGSNAPWVSHRGLQQPRIASSVAQNGYSNRYHRRDFQEAGFAEEERLEYVAESTSRTQTSLGSQNLRSKVSSRKDSSKSLYMPDLDPTHARASRWAASSSSRSLPLPDHRYHGRDYQEAEIAEEERLEYVAESTFRTQTALGSQNIQVRSKLSRNDSSKSPDMSDLDPTHERAPQATCAASSRSLSLPDQLVVPDGEADATKNALICLPPDTECEAVEPADKMEAMDLKIDGMDKKIERIALAVGARLGTGVSEEEDRRRLKEKLKEALETAQRNQMQHVESEKEMWIEYIFGICKPDGRIGKMGSRRVSRLMSVWQRERTFIHPILHLTKPETWKGT